MFARVPIAAKRLVLEARIALWAAVTAEAEVAVTREMLAVTTVLMWAIVEAIATACEFSAAAASVVISAAIA